MISVFDMYKIGIGPSSSHTVGPMKAGRQFLNELLAQNQLARTTAVRADVYGSLSLTGRIAFPSNTSSPPSLPSRQTAASP